VRKSLTSCEPQAGKITKNVCESAPVEMYFTSPVMRSEDITEEF
jgi:hypothetical protein